MNVIETLTLPTIQRRWPRLLRAVRWAGFLTEEQALAVLYAYKGCGLECSGLDIVAARGGNLMVIRAGIRGRRGAQEAKRNADRTRIREAALEAFWGVVAQGYPELEVSSLSANASLDLLLAADSAIDCCLARGTAKAIAEVWR
ncbi:MAG: hypothetical protein H6945_06385 [Zoogloeaceae bacterium]|nr:hypothetical protein [Zoogloeaceae bacterium]